MHYNKTFYGRQPLLYSVIGAKQALRHFKGMFLEWDCQIYYSSSILENQTGKAKWSVITGLNIRALICRSLKQSLLNTLEMINNGFWKKKQFKCMIIFASNLQIHCHNTIHKWSLINTLLILLLCAYANIKEYQWLLCKEVFFVAHQKVKNFITKYKGFLLDIHGNQKLSFADYMKLSNVTLGFHF